MIHFQALLCVIGIAAGQVLFKLAASSLSRTGSVLAPETALLMVIALGVYGFVTLAWIWILRKAELGKVYPLTAYWCRWPATGCLASSSTCSISSGWR